MAEMIVFPTDFSDVSNRALPWVINMAKKFDAAIHCLYVVEEPQIYSTLDLGAISVPTTGELVEGAETRLQDYVKDKFAGTPHSTTAKIVVGHAATEICNYARSNNADVIIMSTHGYSGVKHMLLGSTTEEVLRHAPCPVLSVGGDE